VEELGLDYRELALYSALEVNDSDVALLGDDVLRHIARELVDTVRNNSSIDWAIRENVQVKMRIAVKKYNVSMEYHWLRRLLVECYRV